MAQVAGSKISPVGNVGLEIHEVGVPPPLAKEGVILAFATSEMEYGEAGKVISAGLTTGQSINIVILAIALPAILEAVIT